METIPESMEGTHPQQSVPYLYVNPGKVALLSLCTFGLYAIWWFYWQWRYLKIHRNYDIYTVLRAIFSPLFCFKLFEEVELDLQEQDSELAQSSVLLGSMYLLAHLASRLPEEYWLISVFHVVPLYIVQAGINEFLEAEYPERIWNKSFGFAAGLFAGLGMIFWLLIILSINAPEDKVRVASEIETSEIDFLKEKDYLMPEEEIIFFYSAGLFSIHSDGNLLTNMRVVSYEVTGGEVYFGDAYYEEIYDIEVFYSDGSLDNTDVVITKSSGEEVYLILSPEDGRDRSFVNRLNRNWREVVPEGEEKLMKPAPDSLESGERYSL